MNNVENRIFLEPVERELLEVLVKNKFMTTGEHLKIFIQLVYKLIK